MGEAHRGQAHFRQAELRAQQQEVSMLGAASLGRATATMDVVDRFYAAGEQILTDLPTEHRRRLLDLISWFIKHEFSTCGIAGSRAMPADLAVVADVEAQGTKVPALDPKFIPHVAEKLSAMTLKDRRDFLEWRYQNRKPWAEARPKTREPAQKDFERRAFEQWADDNFPDRRQLGLVLSDLNALDKEAYSKLRRWASNKVAKIDPADFGFPSKVVHYDQSKPAPTGAEVFKALEQGDPRAVQLKRQYMRARYHARRTDDQV